MLTSAIEDLINIPLSPAPLYHYVDIKPFPSVPDIPTYTDMSDDELNKLMQISGKEKRTDVNYTGLLLVSLYYILLYTTSLSISACTLCSKGDYF